jgi:hypothetical protein
LDLKHGLGFYPGFFVLKKKKNPHRLIDVGPQTNNSKLVIEGKIKRMWCVKSSGGNEKSIYTNKTTAGYTITISGCGTVCIFITLNQISYIYSAEHGARVVIEHPTSASEINAYFNQPIAERYISYGTGTACPHCKGRPAGVHPILRPVPPALIHYIHQLTHHKEVAEELTLDVFLKLWEGRDVVTEINNIHGFLFRIAHNTFAVYSRR